MQLEAEEEMTPVLWPCQVRRGERGPSIFYTNEERADIVRLVNVEKRLAAAVARDMGQPASVVRIVAAARGDNATWSMVESKPPRVDARPFPVTRRYP